MTTATLTLSYASDTYVLNVAMTSSPVTVAVQQARDAYQLAQAEGYAGTRAPNDMPDGWSFGVDGFTYTAPEPPAEILPCPKHPTPTN
jgi:hypothetical protein